MRPLIDRFEEKIKQDEHGCINWIGSTSKGYGQFVIGSRKHVRAHRWIYEFVFGKIPDGLVIDHLCRNRKCVNVDHLEIVTAKTNSLRGQAWAAYNARKIKCQNGHPYAYETTPYCWQCLYATYLQSKL